jgi:hypothetical protein
MQGELGDFRDVIAALEQAGRGFVAEVVEAEVVQAAEWLHLPCRWMRIWAVYPNDPSLLRRLTVVPMRATLHALRRSNQLAAREPPKLTDHDRN